MGSTQCCAKLGCLWASWWEGPEAECPRQLCVREFRPKAICPMVGGQNGEGRDSSLPGTRHSSLDQPWAWDPPHTYKKMVWACSNMASISYM